MVYMVLIYISIIYYYLYITTIEDFLGAFSPRNKQSFQLRWVCVCVSCACIGIFLFQKTNTCQKNKAPPEEEEQEEEEEKI